MKKALGFSLLVLFFSFSRLVWGHHEGNKHWASLPDKLGLSTSQKAAFDAYLQEMHSGIMKAHQEAVARAEKYLTPSQYQQFMYDMKMHDQKMKSRHEAGTHHHPMMMSDDEMRDMADKESDKLLLTENQAVQFENCALTFNHQAHKLKKEFFAKLNAILTPAQRTKLAAMHQHEEEREKMESR